MEHNFLTELRKRIPEERIRCEEPMKLHTTFRVGGPADIFICPETEEELREIIVLCREKRFPYYIIGNGSNLLVSDKGYRGAVIQIFKNMNRVTVDGVEIKAQAGAVLSQIASQALQAGLAGFEFASGIPGTIGGACVMNAGAYGGEIRDILKEVRVLTPEGRFLTLLAEELDMGYRTSLIAKKGYIVLEVTLSLWQGDKKEIGARMEELRERRVKKQPLEYPSAGSTFKRPAGYFAGKLIEEAGLRGFQTGGAQVSEKHCGFVINKDGATAGEIYELICLVAARVKENSGVTLETEVKKLGEF